MRLGGIRERPFSPLKAFFLLFRLPHYITGLQRESNMHYYKRNIGDYHKKAGRLSLLQHGVYTILMDAIYDRETFPTEDQAIDWVWASTTEEIEAVKFVLAKFFRLENGVYIQNRISQEIQEYTGLCESNAINGKKGGRPKGSKNKPEKTQSVNKKTQSVNFESEINPNESELNPNHKPLTTNHKPLTNNQVKKASAFDFSSWPNEASDEVWKDFVKHRNSVKAKVSQTVINRMAASMHEMVLQGWSVDDVLAEICTRGWKSFKPEWLLKGQIENNGLSKITQQNIQNITGEW